MGWAKYDEDIREVIEERNRMKNEYYYESRNYGYYIKTENRIERCSSYIKETRIVKRPH